MPDVGSIRGQLLLLTCLWLTLLPSATEIGECSAAIMAAAQLGDEAQLELSLRLGESALCKGEGGRTPLHLAAENGQSQVSLQLLAAGAVMSIDDMGRAPLHLAARAGHMATASLLLEAKGYFELADATIRTPLHHAARKGHLDVVRLLLDAGAQIDVPDGDGRLPIHHTARNDDLFNVTVFLIDRGSNYEMEDVTGFRPLHHSCIYNQPVTAMALLRLGADLYAIDRAGWNALYHAAAAGYSDLVDQIVVFANRPIEYKQPDPNMFVAQDPATIVMGMPGWVFVIVLVLTLGVFVVIPGVFVIRRFGRLSQPYLVDDADEGADELILEIFSFLREEKATMVKLCQEWDKVNVNAISDLHRVKSKAF